MPLYGTPFQEADVSVASRKRGERKTMYAICKSEPPVSRPLPHATAKQSPADDDAGTNIDLLASAGQRALEDVLTCDATAFAPKDAARCSLGELRKPMIPLRIYPQ